MNSNGKTPYQLNTAKLSEIIQPLPQPKYTCDLMMITARSQLINMAGEDDSLLVLNPDFQRGHVWTLKQQQFFIECMLRNSLPLACYQLTFNMPFFASTEEEKINLRYPGLVCIDGLQRFTAIEDFVTGKFRVFNNQIAFEDTLRSAFSLKNKSFKLNVFENNDPDEIIKLYLSLNTAGTAHSEDEIKRVEKLLHCKNNA
ncbi:TPA: DUF262 domain-containing protein [Acinetobacter baumannii]|uniref:DUF262 domain-containing protein n=1 Tax=Acinetobacter baumannii TaxID=470 RepID=UPI00338F1527